MDRVRIFAGVLCGLVVLSLIPWFSAYLFLALVGVEDHTPGPFDLITYWHDYGTNPDYQLYLIIATAAPWLIPVGLAVALLFARRNTLFGDAHFASESEIRRAGLRSKNGLLLGKLRGNFLCASGQLGAIVFAPPRSGKGVGFGIPNLLNWQGSALVTDIKLENFEITSGFRAAHGQQIVVFSPLDGEGRTHRYNPLDFVSQEPGRRINDLQKVTNKLVVTPPRADPMWTNEARDLLEGVILYQMDHDAPATIGKALRFIRGQPDLSDWMEAQVARPQGLDENALLAFNGFLQKAPKEQSGVLSSIKGALSLWSNPLIERATSASDFDPSELRKRAMTIYVGVQPADIGRLAPLMSVFLQQTFDSLLQKLPGDEEPHQVLALLDEFTAMGRLDNVEKGIAYFASYNICLAPIIQDLTQLREVYGAHVEKTFLSTSRYRIAYAQNNEETAAYVSRQMGVKTIKTKSTSRRTGLKGDPWSQNVSESYTKRELMLPHEITQLDRRKEVVLVEAGPPVLADKIVYYKDRAFKGRLLAPVALPPQTPELPDRCALVHADEPEEPLDEQEVEDLLTSLSEARHSD